MKLNEFLPDLAAQNQSLVKMNTAIQNVYDGGFASFAKGRMGGGMQTSSPSPLGIEQLYFDWLRTAYAYRRQFIQDLYLLAYDVTEIRTPLLHLRGEIFRKGLDAWVPKFAVKCKRCGQEYDEVKKKCARCGNKEMKKPDHKQVEYFDDIRKSCNIFGQSFEEILQTCEDDLNIVDDCFIHLQKQYLLSNDTLWSRVLELRRIHPALMEFDLDKAGLPRNAHWLCPFHREDVEIAPGPCKDCGFEMLPVMYIYNHRGKRVYLLEEEIIHMSKFSPSETYGYSPLLTIMQKVLTISGMDRFLYRYFFERKAPTGMILTYTDDPQSLEVERARIEAKMMEDPTYMPWVAVSQKTGRGRTDFVRLFHTLQEMDYMNVRNEIRDRIASMYGVPQVYLNIFEGVGAMSGQSQQLKVFSNIIDADQRRYNEKMFPQLLKAFHITDWDLKLLPPEEKVDSMVLQQAQQRVAIATQMMTLGFQVELKPGTKNIKDLDFIFTGKIENPMQAMMGGAGGAGGMPPLPPGGEGSQGGEGAEGGASGMTTAPPRVPEKGVEKAEGIEHYNWNKRNPKEEAVSRDIEAEKIYQGKNLEEQLEE